MTMTEQQTEKQTEQATQTSKPEEQKRVVFPGEVLAKGMDSIPGFGTYRKDDTIRCSTLGLLNREGKVLKIIPLRGIYVPKLHDVVIGKVFDIVMSGWRLELNSPYNCMLSLKEGSFGFIRGDADLSKIYDLEDYLVVKIVKVTSQKMVDVTMKGPGLKKLVGGRIVTINNHKVPRLIGRKGSMVSMIKQATGCTIIVGQNGLVWVQGKPEMEIVAVHAIKMVEEKSHYEGLTEIIKEYLEKATKQKIA